MGGVSVLLDQALVQPVEAVRNISQPHVHLENHEAAHQESRVRQRTLARIHAIDDSGVQVLSLFSIKSLILVQLYRYIFNTLHRKKKDVINVPHC